jgi:hypothetical protein
MPTYSYQLNVLASETMARVLSNEYRTFHSLLQYLRNDIFKELYFTRDRLDSVDERVNVRHNTDKVDELLVSFKLSFDHLHRFMRSF